MKLPKSKNPVTEIIYNSIWVIINRFTKKQHFIPFREKYNLEKLHQL